MQKLLIVSLLVIQLSTVTIAGADEVSKRPELCNARKCGPGVSKRIRYPSSSDKLDFRLPDTFGRIVDYKDYANVPVLIMSGSCWCGGCQQDAEPLRKIAAKYVRRGLQTIRTVAGDNELAALDFQRHYRLGFVQLMDTNRKLEKRYNRDGWTFLMLADRQGKVVYRVNSPREEDWRKLRNTLDKILAEPVKNETVVRDGVAYMPGTLQRTDEMENKLICERFPSMAYGSDSKVYVVFTSNRNGSSDVFLRIFDGLKWSEDIPFAATDADEYDGTILIDKNGKVWICWTSNEKASKYNIFISSFTNPNQKTTTQLTHAKDDAMHGRMACDEKGRIWVTYYKWHKMGRRSRDKEVYVRVCEDGKWFDEIQVSPTDVPEYEDHSEPAIASRGNDVIICWSWDFHQPQGYTKDARDPTIFVQGVFRNVAGISRICRKKPAVISGEGIDVTPVIAVDNNRNIWCAWDSMNRYQKQICVREANTSLKKRRKPTQYLSKPMANVCTPSFAVEHGKGPTLLWSETKDGERWVLKQADLTGNGVWSKPRSVLAKGNPRYCSVGYDENGQLWIAYSIETEKGREITARSLTSAN